MVAWALIRNLPGLLEVLVLSRLDMRQGASYASTTILNYLLIAVGAMTVFGFVGGQCAKRQWLEAGFAGGVGGGFAGFLGTVVLCGL
ncbi:mechanosensitive channel protein [Escherichia coli]|nr:mechanosensitive channel protein [Escherichia coli]